MRVQRPLDNRDKKNIFKINTSPNPEESVNPRSPNVIVENHIFGTKMTTQFRSRGEIV